MKSAHKLQSEMREKRGRKECESRQENVAEAQDERDCVQVIKNKQGKEKLKVLKCA